MGDTQDEDCHVETDRDWAYVARGRAALSWERQERILPQNLWRATSQPI